MKENETPRETLRAEFLFIYGKGQAEFGYIVFGLNEA